METTDLKDLWLGRKASAPANPLEIISKAKKLQYRTRRKLILANLLLVATMGVIIWILACYQPKMITTRIGAALVLIAIIMQVVASGKMIPLLKNGDTQTPNALYLQQLVRLRKKQAFLESTVLGLYFLLLGSGLMLYLIEFTIDRSLVSILVTYGLTLAWIAFSWFYIRPVTIRKRQRQLNEIIDSLENIIGQLKDCE